MFKTRIILTIIFSMVFLYSCGKQEQRKQDGTTKQDMSTNSYKSPDDAAKKSLEDLKQLVRDDNFKEMGFSSVDEVKSLQLGTAIDVKEIDFQQLLGYNPEIKAEQMIKSPDKKIYPLTSGGMIKSATTVSKSKDTWIIGSIGDAYLPASFLSAKEMVTKQSRDTSMRDAEVSMVSVQGLNMDFAVFKNKEGKWIFSPLLDYPEVKLSKSSPVEAEKLFPVLSEYAKMIQSKYGKDLMEKKLVR